METVLHSRQLSDLPLIQSDVLGTDGQVADLFLRFVQETALVRHDDSRLLALVSDYTFRAFPQATHQVLAILGESPEDIQPVIARSRTGETPAVALSQTLVKRVTSDGVSVLFSLDPERTEASKSMVLSGIRTAVCAPLTGQDDTFAVMQLDIRDRAGGIFTHKDLDRFTVFARQVALVLDNVRLYQDQRRAFESTINALVHSLYLKDVESAHHSERVQKVSVALGRRLGLRGPDLDGLKVAAILHDMGKQGVRDEVLLKPTRLSDEEREEMSQHAGLTQNILDKIRYPAHLRDVPLYAAYHHEKMNGTGPYRIAGDQIPIQARIISVADVFDALVSARVYKDPKPVSAVLRILEDGCGSEWDVDVVGALREILPELLERVYDRHDGRSERSARRRRAA